MPYCFHRKDLAVAHIQPFNNNGTQWQGALSVGAALGHTAINIYADNTFVGIIQGDILGAGLYRSDSPAQVEGERFPLSYQMVLNGLDAAYRYPSPWGVWVCHDITALVFTEWGFTPDDVYKATPTGHGFLYVGAHIISKFGLAGTAPILAGHEAWNAFQSGYESAKQTFRTVTRPRAWNFRLW